jgi:hypothetical protein
VGFVCLGVEGCLALFEVGEAYCAVEVGVDQFLSPFFEPLHASGLGGDE